MAGALHVSACSRRWQLRGGRGDCARQQGVAQARSHQARRARVQKGERLELLRAGAEQHFTRPPARFSEAGLVRALEERGIGRPSTYASRSVCCRRPRVVARAMLEGDRPQRCVGSAALMAQQPQDVAFCRCARIPGRPPGCAAQRAEQKVNQVHCW